MFFKLLLKCLVILLYIDIHVTQWQRYCGGGGGRGGGKGMLVDNIFYFLSGQNPM